jgi:hypothetical protein
MTQIATTDVGTVETVSLDGLAELLDGLLDTGVVVVGDLIIGVGGVDLIRIDLRALVAGVAALDTSAPECAR